MEVQESSKGEQVGPANAAVKSSIPSPSTSLLELLKAGALLPSRNQSLFVAVFALAVAYTSLLQLVNDLAVQPHADKLLHDVMAFNNSGTGGRTARSSDEYAQLLQGLEKDAWDLARPGAAYLLLDATVGSAVWIVALLAAVATCSGSGGKTLSFGKATAAQLMGAALTVAFAYAVGIAYAAVLLAAAAALVPHILAAKGASLLLILGCLLLSALAFALLVYFTSLCVLGVVVAAAEPGRRGAGAVARAWRLLEGRKRRFLQVLAVFAALTTACSKAHALARKHTLSVPALELLWGFLHAVAVAVVKVFAVCTITVFYYQ
ncbi:unnamed protein product [Urochloa decumbens]|uniref:Uncharacterized protein n=1 Tax=Urochloa decumbens TaxID=240449 RepID=A0ABC8ZR43_9POAL